MSREELIAYALKEAERADKADRRADKADRRANKADERANRAYIRAQKTEEKLKIAEARLKKINDLLESFFAAALMSFPTYETLMPIFLLLIINFNPYTTAL